MINSVRNTVLSILNKNNYGYVSPSDFNLFSKLAQLEIFEQYFSDFNKQINNENARISGIEYADLKKAIEENIDTFSVTKSLRQSLGNSYFLPSLLTTGDDYKLLNRVMIYNALVTGGITDTLATPNECVDSTADFVEAGVAVGDVIAFIVSGVIDHVTVITVAQTVLTTTGTPWVATGIEFSVYKPTISEAERVSNSREFLLSSSNFIAPTLALPAYTQEGILMRVYPQTITGIGQVKSQYIRYPRDPKWTFVSLANGEPMFDQSQPDYSDFELPIEAEMSLVYKILQYAGISIREVPVVQFAQSKDSDVQQQSNK